MSLDHTPVETACADCGRRYTLPAYAHKHAAYRTCQPCQNHQVMLTHARWPELWRVTLPKLHRRLTELSVDPSPVSSDYRLLEVSIKFESPVFFATGNHTQLVYATLAALEAQPAGWDDVTVGPLLCDVGPFDP